MDRIKTKIKLGRKLILIKYINTNFFNRQQTKIEKNLKKEKKGNLWIKKSTDKSTFTFKLTNF